MSRSLISTYWPNLILSTNFWGNGAVAGDKLTPRPGCVGATGGDSLAGDSSTGAREVPCGRATAGLSAATFATSLTVHQSATLLSELSQEASSQDHDHLPLAIMHVDKSNTTITHHKWFQVTRNNWTRKLSMRRLCGLSSTNPSKYVNRNWSITNMIHPSPTILPQQGNP